MLKWGKNIFFTFVFFCHIFVCENVPSNSQHEMFILATNTHLSILLCLMTTAAAAPLCLSSSILYVFFFFLMYIAAVSIYIYIDVYTSKTLRIESLREISFLFYQKRIFSLPINWFFFENLIYLLIKSPKKE